MDAASDRTPADASSDTIDATTAPPVDAPSAPPAPSLSEIGVGCTVNAECVSGSCVDGVCCSSAACGACQSCGVSGALGVCSPLPKLTEDPRSACTGASSCDGAGHCALNVGNNCQSGAECVSGACADGVCCASACDQQCYSCNQIGAKGACNPINLATDESAVQVCTGVHQCAVGAAGETACRLNDGQACQVDADCVSRSCRTYFFDGDGDGFGTSQNFIKRCDALALAPLGYSSTPGDCCDFDKAAHPGLPATAYFTTPDACGNFDYDCSGVIEKQPNSCSSIFLGGTTASICGQLCPGRNPQGYTQACR